MNTNYDKLSKAEKQKLGNYCNDALKKRLKKVAILTESEANYEQNRRNSTDNT